MPAITSLRIRFAATYSVWRGRRLRRAIQGWRDAVFNGEEELDEFEEQWIKVGAAVARATMRRMRTCMESWAYSASRSRVTRRVVGKLCHRQLSSSMGAWIANVAVRRLCSEAVEAMQQRAGTFCMADALEVWREEVKEAAAVREKERMSQQFLLAVKDAAMAAEQQRDDAMASSAAAEREAEEARRETEKERRRLEEERQRANRLMMSTIAAFGYRSNSTLLHHAWTAFAQACTAQIMVRTGKRSSAEIHRSRLLKGQLSRTFNSWVALGRAYALAKSRLQAMVRFWSKIEASKAFRSWADAASAAANRRHVIGRVVKVWSLKAAARAMRSWQEAVLEMVARRRKMGRVVKLMKYRQLARAMVSWRRLVLRRREKVIAGKAAARALRLCTEGCVRDPTEALIKVMGLWAWETRRKMCITRMFNLNRSRLLAWSVHAWQITAGCLRLRKWREQKAASMWLLASEGAVKACWDALKAHAAQGTLARAQLFGEGVRAKQMARKVGEWRGQVAWRRMKMKAAEKGAMVWRVMTRHVVEEWVRLVFECNAKWKKAVMWRAVVAMRGGMCLVSGDAVNGWNMGYMCRAIEGWRAWVEGRVVLRGRGRAVSEMRLRKIEENTIECWKLWAHTRAGMRRAWIGAMGGQRLRLLALLFESWRILSASKLQRRQTLAKTISIRNWELLRVAFDAMVSLAVRGLQRDAEDEMLRRALGSTCGAADQGLMRSAFVMWVNSHLKKHAVILQNRVEVARGQAVEASITRERLASSMRRFGLAVEWGREGRQAAYHDWISKRAFSGWSHRARARSGRLLHSVLVSVSRRSGVDADDKVVIDLEGVKSSVESEVLASLDGIEAGWRQGGGSWGGVCVTWLSFGRGGGKLLLVHSMQLEVSLVMAQALQGGILRLDRKALSTSSSSSSRGGSRGLVGQGVAYAIEAKVGGQVSRDVVKVLREEAPSGPSGGSPTVPGVGGA